MNDDEVNFDLHFSDSLTDPQNPFRTIENYLLNVRRIVGILLNVWKNQVSFQINKVVYDREKFSWDEYRAKCLAHQKSLTQLLFVKGAKSLVHEYYKQKSQRQE